MDINRDRIEPGTSAEAYFDLVQIDQEDRKKLIKGYSHGMKNKSSDDLFYDLKAAGDSSG